MTQIKLERIRQSMSQKRLAALSGIDARTLRKIEKGEQVSAESFRAVSNALNIPAAAQSCGIGGTDLDLIGNNAPSTPIIYTKYAAGFAALVCLAVSAIFYFDAGQYSSTPSNLFVSVCAVSFMLIVFGCPMLGAAVVAADTNTVVTMTSDISAQEASPASMLEIVKAVAPQGRFRIISVYMSDSMQSVVFRGFADQLDYSKLSKMLTIRGFGAKVHAG